MAFELENIAILNIKGVDYKCVIWNMSKRDAVNRVNNSKLVIKDSLLLLKNTEFEAKDQHLSLREKKETFGERYL